MKKMICIFLFMAVGLFAKKVTSLEEMFKKSAIKTRFRINSFQWTWKNEDSSHKNHKAMGVGGSINIKSASYKGFSFGIGVFTSQNPAWFRESANDIKYLKSGKDTLCRYKVKTSGEYGITSVSKAYISYKFQNTALTYGRFGFNSVFTSENDTKMIPNTFEGAYLENSFIKNSKFRFAYITAQKLRDHESFHDVITYKNSTGESWANNDDSAVHKGLSYQNFVAKGKDPNHNLIISDFSTKVKGFKTTFSFLSVTDVVKDYVIESHYKINLDNDWAIKPAIRYFIQKDDGAAFIAGYTNLSGKVATGYNENIKNSVDSYLVATKVDIMMPKNKGFFRIGYSKVADKADIITPWRGFPTGGFTRAMGQYNWYANTKTTLFRIVYKSTSKLKTSLRYAIEDFDDHKVNVQADAKVLNLDLDAKITKNFSAKFRLGIGNLDEKAGKDLSYRDIRVEFNYYF